MSRFLLLWALLFPSVVHAGAAERHNTGVWVWRAGWIQLAVGSSVALVGAFDQSSDDTLVVIGGGVAALAPITMTTGALVSHSAVRTFDRRVSGAPGGWAVGATIGCYGGFVANLASGLPIPPVADCGFSLALPAWQMGINQRAFEAGYLEEEDEPLLDGYGSNAPRVQFAVVPVVAGQRTGVGVVGVF